jgi:hypothetical protein
MKEVDPKKNSLDRREPEVSIDSDCSCIICQSAMRSIALRPLPICTPCLCELSDRIEEAQGAGVVLSFVSIEHSQN